MNNTNKIVVAVLVIAVIGIFAYYQKVGEQPVVSEVTPSTETVSTSTSSTATTSTDTAAMGKINIDVVCQGALAYMSFKDGASADAFVAECKEGKHPEVIERFKADMNLGDGAQI
ncbi:MAG: hypothetical protein K9M11_00645 [Candidatus Pacebacteria bacterium]|nr:hypothetical protein [Candidatus Paceibacterota bacterium]